MRSDPRLILLLPLQSHQGAARKGGRRFVLCHHCVDIHHIVLLLHVLNVSCDHSPQNLRCDGRDDNLLHPNGKETDVRLSGLHDDGLLRISRGGSDGCDFELEGLVVLVVGVCLQVPWDRHLRVHARRREVDPADDTDGVGSGDVEQVHQAPEIHVVLHDKIVVRALLVAENDFMSLIVGIPFLPSVSYKVEHIATFHARQLRLHQHAEPHVVLLFEQVIGSDLLLNVNRLVLGKLNPSRS
mmetsp:Transcript_24081/g.54035  ORF Transcript_24081/g.54035 Transcript_24081/m.54035 type:complete len:241 (+) Transcript_24081:1865-2587(+)